MKKILSPFIATYSWFKKQYFGVRITILFFLIYFGLFYISGFFAERHFWPTNFKWVLNATKNDYGVIEENVLKLIEITISALAFTGLIASILYQREELIVTKNQLKDQSENIQRSIDETNKNFERNLLNNFNNQISAEIGSSNFQEIHNYLNYFHRDCINNIDASINEVNIAKINELNTLTQTLIVPPLLQSNISILIQKIDSLLSLHQKRQSKTTAEDGYASNFYYTSREIATLITELQNPNYLTRFKKKLDNIDINILNMISNMLKSTAQFNTDKKQILSSDPVFLLLQSIIEKSNFIYKDSTSLNNFRIKSSTLANFFLSIGLIKTIDMNGDFGGYSESNEYHEFLKLMQEYGIIRDTWHFGYYALYGDIFDVESSSKE